MFHFKETVGLYDFTASDFHFFLVSYILKMSQNKLHWKNFLKLSTQQENKVQKIPRIQ